jgi:hypothetical protein
MTDRARYVYWAKCHPDRRVWGRGMCGPCYGEWWKQQHPERAGAWHRPKFLTEADPIDARSYRYGRDETSRTMRLSDVRAEPGLSGSTAGYRTVLPREADLTWLQSLTGVDRLPGHLSGAYARPEEKVNPSDARRAHEDHEMAVEWPPEVKAVIARFVDGD